MDGPTEPGTGPGSSPASSPSAGTAAGGLRVVSGGRDGAATDPRVSAVLEVLRGDPAAEVAVRWSVDPVLLRRWVGAFVDAGTAQVTNRPDGDAARQRDRFLAAFAHEVRTPLTVAQGWVQMLREGDLPPAMVDQSLGRLHEALARLGERSRDVELLAAASLGRLTLDLQPVRLGELVADLPDLAMAPEVAQVVVRVDPELFGRVLRDVYDASRLPPVPAALRLEVPATSPGSPASRWSEVRVVRDADPIDTRVLQALFDPFDVNDDATGVTIGLYLARALTVAHGGTLGLEQDESSGTFWVRVPSSSARMAATGDDHEEDA